MQRLLLTCAGESLEVLADRALFWPRATTLLIADAHLGKASAFRRAGIPVPEQMTNADLERLSHLIHATGAQRLVVLGDLFHAPTGQSHTMIRSFETWRRAHSALAIDLVMGNHDRAIVPFPAEWRVRIAEELREDPFVFAHARSSLAGSFALLGHIHPAVRVAGLRLPCFHVREAHAVLPAFGSFTGMHAIIPRQGDRIVVFNEGEIMEISATLLSS